jgi:hypothetical protein
MTSAIVTSTYRYKPPPRKLKPRAATEGPAIVIPADPKKMRRAATRCQAIPQPANDDGAPEQSAVITKRPTREEMSPEQHKRRGDAADMLWRELVRRVAPPESD